ncbi:MAG: methyltransferase domain-containing protein [Planctomycetes bacterium]|nr:methyltransferase domain-containing protein [Planctomycetota bacterium]
MAHSAVQRFYRYHAYFYDSTRWMILHGRRRAAQRLGLRPDCTVLEIGCGTGLNFPYVLEQLDARRGRVVGLDFSADMLRQAEKRVRARGWTNVELVQGDATQLRLGTKFDGILFAYSLTMIPDWPRAIQCAGEHLKPGGRLVVLDFGRFAGWGPLGAVMRGWLRANHVETLRPYVETLRKSFPSLEVFDWFGGYNFTAVGQKQGS